MPVMGPLLEIKYILSYIKLAVFFYLFEYVSCSFWYWLSNSSCFFFSNSVFCWAIHTYLKEVEIVHVWKLWGILCMFPSSVLMMTQNSKRDNILNRQIWIDCSVFQAAFNKIVLHFSYLEAVTIYWWRSHRNVLIMICLRSQIIMVIVISGKYLTVRIVYIHDISRSF